MRATALIALRRFPDARAVAADLIALAPDSSAGYAKLAGIEELLGNQVEGLNSLRLAREREKDPQRLAQMDAILRAQAPVSPRSETDGDLL